LGKLDGQPSSIIRIVPASVDIADISVFFYLLIMVTLITRFTYGSVVDEIDDKHVGKSRFFIKRDQAFKRNINDLALEANAKR
jgi:type I restriction enzyme S subunit